MKPGKFVGKLITESVADGWERILQPKRNPFRYITSYGRAIQPRDGFLTDLGSVPRGLWIVFPPHFKKKCVVLHDWDYDRHIVSRKQADLDLCEMIFTFTGGDAFFCRNCYYYAVRLFGGWAWNKPDNAKLFSQEFSTL